MTDKVPEDILALAAEIEQMAREAAKTAIAHAIYEERKRCAKVASMYLEDIKGCDMRDDEPQRLATTIMAPPNLTYDIASLQAFVDKLGRSER